ncbi:S-adenosyl methyltransferase [Actinocorallia herbida]|uniref:S-adenosyl methyltransferase n=1 Tax=Actinocorallia herbida TaxID=58109 RepID=A0A3N1D0H7_9ACTN|nr:SAM-dependent methyltransferase [Actinocorallia herbida]ROO87043.1 S-adenosyl methyltransferase [Actinocorallia herbida]
MSEPLHRIDGRVPNFARVMDYLEGGKDHFAVDRKVGDELLGIAPDLPVIVAEQRRFLRRAIARLAEEGIRQYVDIGCGLPTCGSPHEILQDLGVDARVAYVDEDPVVVVHGRAILDNSGKVVTPGRPLVRVLQGDPRDPDGILDHPELTGFLDPAKPTAVLVRNILAVMDDATAATVAGRLVDRLSPGDRFLLIHVVRDSAERKSADMTRLFTDEGLLDEGRGQVRTLAQIQALLDGLDLLPPGLVPLPAWHPEPAPHAVAPDAFWSVGAVGRKP